MMLDWQQVLPIETFPQITFPEDSFEGRLAGRREDGSELQRGFRIMFRYFELLALLSCDRNTSRGISPLEPDHSL